MKMENKRDSHKQMQTYDYEFLMAQYQAISDQEINHFSQMWNTPSLLFVAQAFLWDVALSDTINPVICFLTSAFSVLIGYTSLRSFVRSRLLEIADCIQLHSLEIKMRERFLSIDAYTNMAYRTIAGQKGNESNKRLNKQTEYMSFRENNKLSQKSAYGTWRTALIIALVLAVCLSLWNFYKMIIFLLDTI